MPRAGPPAASYDANNVTTLELETELGEVVDLALGESVLEPGARVHPTHETHGILGH